MCDMRIGDIKHETIGSCVMRLWGVDQFPCRLIESRDRSTTRSAHDAVGQRFSVNIASGHLNRNRRVLRRVYPLFVRYWLIIDLLHRDRHCRAVTCSVRVAGFEGKCVLTVEVRIRGVGQRPRRFIESRNRPVARPVQDPVGQYIAVRIARR